MTKFELYRSRGAGLEKKLTGESLDSGIELGLERTRRGAQSFIAHADEDDGDEGNEKRRRGANVPLAEDNTEVIGIPCEEHLDGG